MASSGSSGSSSGSSSSSTSTTTANPFTKKKKLTLAPEITAEQAGEETTTADQAATEAVETVATPAESAKLMLPPTPAEALLPKSPLLPRDTAANLLTRIVTPPTLLRPEAATAGLNLFARDGAFNQVQAQAEQIGGNLPAIQTRLEGAAENYRNLPINATPQQRAAVLQDYANMANAKAFGQREAATADRRIANIAGAAAAGLVPGSPEAIQAANAAVAQYRNLNPEQQRIAYYNATSGVEKPGFIGGAPLLQAGPNAVPGSAGMIVPHVAQEIAARSEANRQVNIARDNQKLIRSAEREVRLAKDKDAKDKGEAKLKEARKEQDKHLVDSGLKDPAHPTAGWNTTGAYNQALTGGMESQQAAAQARLTQMAGQKPLTPAQKSQQDLVNLTEKRRLEDVAAREELQRQRMIARMQSVYRR